MKLTTLLVSASFLLSGLAGGVALAGKDVTLDQLPARVRASIEKEVGKGTIEDIEVETRPDGSTVYEIEFELDNVEWDLHVDVSGKVLKKERDD